MITVNKANPTPGETTSTLVEASDSGYGLHFDGAGYVDCGDTTILDGATRLSVETIIQPETKQAGFTTGSVLILGKSKAADCFTLGIDSDYKILFRVGTATATSSALTVGSVYHIAGTYDGATIKIYINGNLDGTATLASYAIPNTTDHLSIGRGIATGPSYSTYGFVGAVFRGRLWNKALTAAEVTDTYENATVPFADQWGSETNKINVAVDQYWGTNQADTGNDTNDRATFNTNYVWETHGSPTDISVASNVLTFSTASATDGIRYPGVLTAGQRYRVVINTGTFTGNTYIVQTYATSLTTVGTLSASTKNVIEFVAESGTNGILYIFPSSATAGTIQLSAGTVPNEIVEIGVVADYDCAFSNPSVSRTMQDRATHADGTASASGVTQLTSIPQLNAKALRIGTTAATPADNEIACGKITSVGDSTFAGGGELFLGRQGANEASVMGNAGSKLLLGADGNAGKVEIATSGAVTMPTNPAFSATPSVNQNDIAINTATDVVFGTEIFDQGSNFASNTFTAPVAGRYQLNAILGLMYIDSAADFYQISIVTSNRSYHYTFDPDFGQDATYFEIGPSVLADMDANDTAVVKIYQSGGTAQADIEKSRTYFNGFLAC